MSAFSRPKKDGLDTHQNRRARLAAKSQGLQRIHSMRAALPNLCVISDSVGPSYHAYPSADRFVEACAAENFARALDQRRGGTAALGLPLALCLHMPFCAPLGCNGLLNTVAVKSRHRVSSHLDALTREVELVVQHLGPGRAVNCLHLRGGLPRALGDQELQSLMTTLKRNFRLIPHGEYSLQINPLAFDHQRLTGVAELGFNQLRIDLQELDSRRQHAAHRLQETRQLFTLMDVARSLHFQPVSLDIGYDPSRHTPDSIALALGRAAALRPDRIALRASAPQPRQCLPQRGFTGDKLQMWSGHSIAPRYAHSPLVDAGYLHLGMDEFALPDDALSVSRRQGRLHRNFQGYSAQPDCDSIGFGVSAISRVGSIFSQNARTISDYCCLLHYQQLPVVRGLALSRDDLLRWAVITALLCQGRVPFEALEQACQIDFRVYFKPELETLQAYVDSGLVRLIDDAIEITAVDQLCAPAVASIFDRYRQADLMRAQFSGII